ncbi:hypothetical protein OOK31_25415 [Streptomyces sp. NBC_00249]|uniref:hypothetical protein n=1 Tax=Streptomyces sp. NBC_00249 TaxID=2975690 RepID=UPI002255085C|nr:hypothetical protein [Streptomyces sp. NBC_00249]MCX5197196.1 hypothetical protein [Streptomyces sp. NBC_00249]
MSIWTTAYLAYGQQIPDTDTDVLDAVLGRLDGGVGHLSAGAYDRERLYLVTGCHSAELGTPETVEVPRVEDAYHVWDEELRTALAALGIEEQPFAWHLIAAQS